MGESNGGLITFGVCCCGIEGGAIGPGEIVDMAGFKGIDGLEGIEGTKGAESIGAGITFDEIEGPPITGSVSGLIGLVGGLCITGPLPLGLIMPGMGGLKGGP